MNFLLGALKITSTPPMGVFGYIPALLQVVGFATGALAVYGSLSSQPYCDRCSRYLRRQSRCLRYTADTTALQQNATAVKELVQADSMAAALVKQGEFGTAGEKDGGNFRTVAEVRLCASCGRHWVKYSVDRLEGNRWTEVPELHQSDLPIASSTLEQRARADQMSAWQQTKLMQPLKRFALQILPSGSDLIYAADERQSRAAIARCRAGSGCGHRKIFRSTPLRVVFIGRFRSGGALSPHR